MTNDPLTFAKAWSVETVDLTSRVSAAIGASSTPTGQADLSQLILELKKLRQEMSEFQRTTVALQEEVFRLRFELAEGTSRRIAPYASLEGFTRRW